MKSLAVEGVVVIYESSVLGAILIPEKHSQLTHCTVRSPRFVLYVVCISCI